MFRRWLIRGLLILLLTLLVTGWAVSTCCTMGCMYNHGRTSVACSVAYGHVGFAWVRGRENPEGWLPFRIPLPFRVVGRDFFWQYHSSAFRGDSALEFTLAGFHYRGLIETDSLGRHYEDRQVAVPIWFLIVVTGVVLLFAWKRTAPVRTGKAFPVEPQVR